MNDKDIQGILNPEGASTPMEVEGEEKKAEEEEGKEEGEKMEVEEDNK
jgi:hypothetical protein